MIPPVVPSARLNVTGSSVSDTDTAKDQSYLVLDSKPVTVVTMMQTLRYYQPVLCRVKFNPVRWSVNDTDIFDSTSWYPVLDLIPLTIVSMILTLRYYQPVFCVGFNTT